jgi:hypothetical protein
MHTSGGGGSTLAESSPDLEPVHFLVKGLHAATNADYADGLGFGY